MATRISVLCAIVLPLFLGCEFSVSIGDKETHGPAPKSPEIVIKAPPHHVVSLATMYYNHEGTTTNWESNKVRHIIPDDGQMKLELEDGHDGYLIELQAPAAGDVSVVLLSDGKELKKESLTSGGTISIKAGKTRKEDDPIVRDILLEIDTRKSVAKVIDAFQAADLSGVVSTGDESLVDASMLASLAEATKKHLGKMSEPDFDQWAAWETKNEGTRCYGPLSFKDGDALVSFVLRKGDVVGFDFQSETLPEDWFEKPVDAAAYHRRGEKMVRDMLTGDMDAAHTNLDTIYHDQISVAALENLAKAKLPVVPADEIQTIEVIDETFKKKDNSTTTAYSVFYEVNTSDGSKLVLRVPFELIIDHDSKIGRLSGFYIISQSSGSPKTPDNSRVSPGENSNELDWVDRQKQLVVKVISHAANGDHESFFKSIHPDAQRLIHRDKLQSDLARIAKRLGPIKHADPSSVAVQRADQDLGGSSIFTARLGFENGEALCRVEYSDFQPVGISVETDGFSAETFGAVTPPEGLLKHAHDFWLNIFDGDPEKSYELMIPKGQENIFPRDVFLKFTKPIALPEKVKTRTIHVNDVRIFNGGDKESSVVLAVYQLLERSDDRYSTCRLRYAIEEDGKFQLTNFDTVQFDDRYAISDFTQQEKFLAAMATGKVDNVLPLIHPFDVEGINIPTFTAFVEQFAETTGKLTAVQPHQMSAIRSYDKEGSQRTDARGVAVFEKRAVGLSTNHVYGMLEGFNFEDPENQLAGFPSRIKDLSVHEKHGASWLREMLVGDVEKAIAMLPRDFRKQVEPETEDYKKARAEFLTNTGPLKSIKAVGKEYLEDDHVWQINYEMEFEKDGGKAYVRYESTAFSGSIFGFNYKRNKAP